MKLFLAAAGAATAVAAAPTAQPCATSNAVNASWAFAGPSTYITRNDDTKMASAGAAQNIVAGADGAWFLGSVNGGVWRTTSLGKERPHWENVLDGQPVTCSSISAMHVSPHDARRVYAGCGGSTSSMEGHDWNVMNSGDWAGVMTSADGGSTWSMLPGFPPNYYVTDILEPAEGTLLVSAQSHLYNRLEGGIWRSTDGGATFHQVDHTPTFTLTPLPAAPNQADPAPVVLATHAHQQERGASLSEDGGLSFRKFGDLPWATGATPFYTCAAPLSFGHIVVAALTRKPGLPNNTDSQFFVYSGTNYTAGSGTWTTLAQPTAMDEDSMPKDRMAIMADPTTPNLMYVAGNAGALAWRVNVSTGKWTQMWDAPDVTDGSMPHGDCRNYAWDGAAERLLLVSDGGVFAREQPRAPGGKWVSLNGDYASMELLTAHYDWRGDRYIAGAQDNCAQVTETNSKPGDVAVGFVEGDGTVTLVDSAASPSRLFGTTQFLGVGTIDIDPTVAAKTRASALLADGDDDDDCGGLCFVQGDDYINVPIDKHFPEPSSFPFFVQPYGLNRQDPTRLVFWANGTATRPSAFYEFSIPYNVTNSSQIPAPTLIQKTPEESFFLDFVSGGRTPKGGDDATAIAGISDTHLYVRSAAVHGGEFEARAFPVRFARPVTLEYDPDSGARILGPVTHGRTANLAVATSNSDVIAVTGWPSVSTNNGDEVVILTFDAGLTWHNITGNLRHATGVVGKVRPGGVHIVDLAPAEGESSTGNDAVTERAVVVGTSNGVFVTFVGADGPGPAHPVWSRLGGCGDFPIVLTAAVDYEPHSDRLVAATFGRGIYTLPHAQAALKAARQEQQQRQGQQEQH